jgi:uncharacterized protein YihD (DUF1040 family)
VKPNCLIAFVGFAVITSAFRARADFTPPADGKLTEMQVVSFIEITKKVNSLSTFDKAIDNRSDDVLLKALKKDSANEESAAKEHGMSKAEFRWIRAQMEGLLVVADWEVEMKPMLGRPIEADQLAIQSVKGALASCEQAQKEGRWYVHSVEYAKSRRDEAAALAKMAKDEIQKAQADIQTHEREAKESEELERNPPGNVQAENRAGYVDSMKNKEKAAREAALEAEERLKKSQAGFDACKSALDTDNALIEHPDPLETPSTDADKAQAKADNQQYIGLLRQQIEFKQQPLDEVKKEYASQEAEAQKYQNLDADNLALVKKHLAEFDDAATTGK